MLALLESLSQDTVVSIIGIAAGALTTSSFVPQIVKGYRTNSMGDVSRYLMGVFATGTVLWIVYGIYKADFVIIGANAVALAFNIILLYMKVAYAKKPAKTV